MSMMCTNKDWYHQTTIHGMERALKHDLFPNIRGPIDLHLIKLMIENVLKEMLNDV